MPQSRWLRTYGWRWVILIGLVVGLVAGTIWLTTNVLSPQAPLAESPASSAATTSQAAGPTASAMVESDGMTAVIVDNGATLHAYVAYPVTGIATVDNDIADWAWARYEEAFGWALESNPDDAEVPELNVSFERFEAPDDMLGIDLRVSYSSPTLAHPSDTAATFAVDTTAGQILTTDRMIDPNRRDQVLVALQAQMAELFGGEAEGAGPADEAWLERLVPMPQGLGVVLERGAVLPSYLGTQRIELPYDGLGQALLRPYDAAASVPATPTATADETPTSPPEPAEPTQSAAPVEPAAPPAGGGAPARQIDPSQPMIALTFDDGPSENVGQILAALDQVGGRATFFVVGNRVASYAGQAAAVVAQGSQIAGHSWDHRDLTNLSDEEIRDELTTTAEAIWQASGVSPTSYRPPYGAFNDRVKSISADLGMSLVYWSIDTEDWRTQDAAETTRRVLAEAQNGAIVLCHDIYTATADAAVQIIPELAARGYQLVTIDELRAAKGIPADPGSIIFDAIG